MRTTITRFIAATTLALLASPVAAQNLPTELQVSRVLCNQFPESMSGVVQQLPAGGSWEHAADKAWVYGVKNRDPMTNRTNELRYMFVRGENELVCGDTIPCAALTRVSVNGRELVRFEYQQFCQMLLTSVKTRKVGLAGDGAAPAPQGGSVADDSDKETNTVGGRLLIEGSLVLLGSRQVFLDMEPRNISIHSGWPKGGPAKYVLLMASSGGTACPALFRVVDAASGRATEPFGSCSDIPEVSFDGDALLVSFPAANDAPAEAYRYQGGRLTKLR